MSRQLKYRAWDKEANIMVYSDHRTRKLYDVYYGFEMNSKGELECNWEGEFTESHVLDGGILDNIMQSTGLHDKNGKEIYEGDIVKCTDGADEISKLNSDTGIGKIEWLEKWGFWNISNIENGLGDISYNGYVEVIGNIYENPELLKED